MSDDVIEHLDNSTRVRQAQIHELYAAIDAVIYDDVIAPKLMVTDVVGVLEWVKTAYLIENGFVDPE